MRRRWRAHAALSVLGRCAAAAAAPALAVALLAFLLPLSDRLLLAAVAVTAIVALAAVAIVAIRSGGRDLIRRISDRQIARFVEERTVLLHGDVAATDTVVPFQDALVSAVAETEQDEPASAFAAFVIDDAARKLAGIGPERIVASRDLRRAGLGAAAGLALLAASILIARPPIGRAIDAAWVTLLPGALQVEVRPGDVRLASGKPLTIAAVVRARGRQLTGVTPELIVSDGHDTRTVPMTAVDGRFEFAFEAIDRTFRYRVAAGSSRSAEYTVTALVPPRVRRIDLRYEYPAFARTPPREEIDAGDIYAPSSTRVRVRVHTDKPVTFGQLALGRAGDRALDVAGERLLEATLVLTTDDSYRIALADADGLQSPGDTEYFIRVMEDRPPDVRIVRPDGDQQITPLEEVAIEARAEDDHGIARMELVYSVAGRAPIIVPLAGGGTETVKTGRHVLPVEDLKVQPGDVISYYARARDVSRGKRSTEASSDMYFLEVRPFSEEFVNAPSQGMAGAAGDQIDALIAAQKEIISATWNIERRASAGAGRSTSDVSAIAAAQSELKTRVEQMTGAARGRGLLRFPQQIVPSRQARGARPGSDPVGTAISAMGRAVDRLQGPRPADALAHEMAALQGLLQAQAEIRRREIAQAGAAGGGMGRQGQDLSALFDKELQRQQRTNYETQARVEPTQDRQDERSALDAIRDLAKRQEDLARRQRDLARQERPAEERKRELEQLAREQNQLREQADDLAKRLDQRTGSPQGENGSSGMRSAAEQMRSAASDLQRQDLSGASDRSGRAAAALRRLEQQMQGDSAGSRQRAAGELRMEAQQIAEEQRRIAGEAGRLDKGAADADGWRRLAGEKEKLADRVDELQRSTRQLAASERQGGDAERAGRTAAAADELEHQRIAGRIRETAKEMRDAGAPQAAGRSAQAPPSRRAEAEQDLARALDRIVDRLSGSADGIGEIAKALDESRKMREGLDRLEDQIRDAEAQQRSGRAAAGRSGASNGQPNRLQQLREEYAREAQRTRETLSRLERATPGSAIGGTSPEGHEWSVTDQGTEAFKQDFSQWESLKKDVTSALERYEAAVVARAARQSLRERLSGGGSDRVPDAYRDLIARYYESLARKQ
ncbi:MAG TPA: hypothetical protein VFJ02_10910 [Vicinamibacterales bacterium]|nr:hypothetical protein [Vicinamibacterales bacterium]